MSDSSPPLAVVVLAGGKGSRLQFDGPKVLAPLSGSPALAYVLDASDTLMPSRTVVVVCHQKERVEEYLEQSSAEWTQSVVTADQGQALGTGHAVLMAEEALKGFEGDVLVLFGDSPLIRPETLAWLLEEHRKARPACTLATAVLDQPRGYGRIVRSEDGNLRAVVEERDADDATRAIQEVHCGLAVFDSQRLFAALKRIDTSNAQSEYYLTDAYHLLQDDGGRVRPCVMDDLENALGFNTPADLLDIRQRVRRRILERHQAAGVEITDPTTVFIDRQVTIGRGTLVHPFTVMSGAVRVGEGCEIGPFSHLRTGARLEEGAVVGNFVEMKNSTLGPKSKAKHLTYLGDTTVGAGSNIGAGTITANYDGHAKHPTTIGERAFIGSGAILVAPSTIGAGATVGAGAVVPRGKSVEAGETVVGVPARPIQRRREGDDPSKEQA